MPWKESFHKEITDRYYLLIDINPDLVRAWEEAFEAKENVKVMKGDITNVSCDAIAAHQMHQAFLEIELGQRMHFENFGDASRYHWEINQDGMIYD